MMMLKYYFTITDVEFDDVYDFEGYFEDHMEADRFITENEAVGNTVVMNYPFYEEVPMDKLDLNALHPER